MSSVITNGRVSTSLGPPLVGASKAWGCGLLYACKVWGWGCILPLPSVRRGPPTHTNMWCLGGGRAP